MALTLTELERTVPGFKLGPLSLAVGTEIVSVLGPSGCGKTTMLEIVAGIQAVDDGEVVLDGRELTDRPPEARGVAMVVQEGALFPHLTARENIAYAATDRTRVESVAETLGVTHVLDRRPDTLSGGERQRVALARALAADPEALLLDEPLANLDAPVRQRLRGDVRELLADLGVPVIHVTHDQRAAAAIGDRVAVMQDGGLDHVGPPETVFTRPATEFVATFTGSTILPATVEHIDGDTAAVWAGYPLVEAPAYDPGTRVALAVRPAELTLAPRSRKQAGTRVVGRVRRRLFEGDRHRVTVAVTGASPPLAVAVPPDEGPPPAVGDRVTVHIPRRAIHLLPGDTQGLRTDGASEPP